MARLPTLIDALARYDRRGRPTIAHIARQVRDAGLIVSSKRGVGAAVMTERDAATLLLAVCGDSSPQGAVAAVHNLRSLVPDPNDTLRDTQREDMPEWMEFLREKISFADAVERLIANAPLIAQWHETYMEEWEEEAQGVSEAEFSMQWMVVKSNAAGGAFRPGYARALRIVSYVPGLAAEIHLGRPWKRLEGIEAFHEHYAPADAWVGAVSDDGARRSNSSGETDCLITIEIGLPTLTALHAAVNDMPIAAPTS